MKTTFLLGNGFDICQGLKTSYSDFYNEHYVKLPKDGLSDSLRLFREEIEDFVKNESDKDGDSIDWSDLESALGKYSEKLNRPEDYIEIVLDVNKELKAYIQIQNDILKLDEPKAKKMIKDFSLPDSLDYLSVEDNSLIRLFKKKFSGLEIINIVTFNYTDTIERVLDHVDLKTNYANTADNLTSLKKIIHIHGDLKNDPAIIVGVNDPSQIANTKFQDNDDVLDVAVKPRTNSMFRNGKNTQVESLIRTTDLFVIFGASIGETDKKWWTLIGKEMTNRDVRLLYFVYENPGENNPLLLGKKRREYELKFMKAAGVPENSYSSFRSRILVAYNTNIFR